MSARLNATTMLSVNPENFIVKPEDKDTNK